jgi:hypothetical protein
VFALELLDLTDVVNMFVVAQVVFVGEFSFTHWTLIRLLFDGEVYGEMDVQDGFADGGVGAEMTCVGAGSVD